MNRNERAPKTSAKPLDRTISKYNHNTTSRSHYIKCNYNPESRIALYYKYNYGPEALHTHHLGTENYGKTSGSHYTRKYNYNPEATLDTDKAFWEFRNFVCSTNLSLPY